MSVEKFRWLAGVIAAHPGGKVEGRTRLQKTMMLLQQKGLPTDYLYSIYFYGPYSDGVSSDVVLLESLGLVEESPEEIGYPTPRYTIIAQDGAELGEMEEYRKDINSMAKASLDALELAATYRAFFEMYGDHDDAMKRMKHKKAKKCNDKTLADMDNLLQDLGLDAA